MQTRYGYDLSRTCAEIRPHYHHVEICKETAPPAITAFLESQDFEHALRLAVSLGGDSDTLACITGSIAEGYYPIPQDLRHQTLAMLNPPLLEIYRRWIDWLKQHPVPGAEQE